MKALTIYDVARAAGVSVATVSRVLNHHRGVRPGTREQVMRAVRELNYQPNLIASALMTGQTRTVGLLVPDISNPFFAEICRGVEDAGAERGFSLVICNTDERLDLEAQKVNLLRKKAVDGIIFASAEVGDANIVELQQAGYPIVLISREVDGIEANSVSVDDFQGGYLATKHLIGLGHRRIAHLAGPLRTRPGLYRKKGYEAALEQADIEVDPALIAAGEFNLQSGRAMARALLERLPEPPTAVFAGNDLIAIGAIKELRQAGLRVPADVSVVGYDHTALAEVADPPLTSIAQPMHEMGRRAMELLLAAIAESPSATRTHQIVLPPRLVVASSTAAAPTGAGSVAARAASIGSGSG